MKNSIDLKARQNGNAFRGLIFVLLVSLPTASFCQIIIPGPILPLIPYKKVCTGGSVTIKYTPKDHYTAYWQYATTNSDASYTYIFPYVTNQNLVINNAQTGHSGYYRLAWLRNGYDNIYSDPVVRLVILPKQYNYNNINVWVEPSTLCKDESDFKFNFSYYNNETINGVWNFYEGDCGDSEFDPYGIIGVGDSAAFGLMPVTVSDGSHLYSVRAVPHSGNWNDYCEVSPCYNFTIKKYGVVSISSETSLKTHNVCQGSPFQVQVEGSGLEANYKWVKLPGTQVGTNSSFSIAQVKPEDAGTYQCTVYNSCGGGTNSSVKSSQFTLNVIPAPVVVTQPAGKTTCPDPEKTITLSVTANNANTYQWKKGDAGVGTNSPSLDISAGNPANSGNYTCTVSNSACPAVSVQSNIATVTIHPEPPVIDLGPDRYFCDNRTITLDAGSGFSTYLWRNGTHTRTLEVGYPGNFYVTGVDSRGCTSTSNTVNIDVAYPWSGDQLCVVTIDLNTGKNLLVWEKIPDKGIVAYKIYREFGIGNFEPIATVASDKLSIYKDLESNPENQAHLYRIRAVDTCGNESDVADSPYHKTLFLSWVSSDNGTSLTWTDYAIEGRSDLSNYLHSYEIYRGTDAMGLSLFKTVGSTNDYLDNSPEAMLQKFYYRVAAVLSEPCYPEGSLKGDQEYKNAFSNLEDNHYQAGYPNHTEENHYSQALKIYPNPSSHDVMVQFTNPYGAEYSMLILNASGKLVYRMNGISGNEVIIPEGSLQKGIYVVRLKGRNIYQGRLLIK
jgi:hypothetical protein